MDDYLEALMKKMGFETKYIINYYGDGKKIWDAEYENMPTWNNVDASFEEVAEAFFTRYNTVTAEIIEKSTGKLVARRTLQ